MYKKRLGKNPKKCKECGEFLDYRNETGYCKKHSSQHRFSPRYCKNCNKRLKNGQNIYCSKDCMIEYKKGHKTKLKQEYIKSLPHCVICDNRIYNHNSSSKFCHECKTKFKTIILKNTYSIDILRLYIQAEFKICRVHRIFYQTHCPLCDTKNI